MLFTAHGYTFQKQLSQKLSMKILYEFKILINDVDLFIISYYDSCLPNEIKACITGFDISQSFRARQILSNSRPDSKNQEESE